MDSPLLHQAIYCFIILAEAIVAALSWLGSFRLFRCISDSKRFDKAKSIAILGLTLGIILWFTCFITVGGEWFLMWQSGTWNGQVSGMITFLPMESSAPDVISGRGL
jgi:predicted small integral membrane protein